MLRGSQKGGEKKNTLRKRRGALHPPPPLLTSPRPLPNSEALLPCTPVPGAQGPATAKMTFRATASTTGASLFHGILASEQMIYRNSVEKRCLKGCLGAPGTGRGRGHGYDPPEPGCH